MRERVLVGQARPRLWRRVRSTTPPGTTLPTLMPGGSDGPADPRSAACRDRSITSLDKGQGQDVRNRKLLWSTRLFRMDGVELGSDDALETMPTRNVHRSDDGRWKWHVHIRATMSPSEVMGARTTCCRQSLHQSRPTFERHGATHNLHIIALSGTVGDAAAGGACVANFSLADVRVRAIIDIPPC